MIQTTITILGHTYHISECDPGMWCSNGMGRSDVRRGTIELNIAMTDDVKRSTLIHEVIHQLADILDISSIRESESNISALAAGFYTILKDNPELVSWLIKRDVME